MKHRIQTAALLAMSFIGCGGGSSGTGVYSSGIETDRLLSTITEKDRMQICDRFAVFRERVLGTDFVCSFFGIALASISETNPPSVAECVALRDDCENSPDEIDPEDACPVSTTTALASCGATIGELDRCLDEEVSALKSLKSQVQCSVISQFPDHPALQSYLDSLGMGLAPTCEQLQAKCPDAFK